MKRINDHTDSAGELSSGFLLMVLVIALVGTLMGLGLGYLIQQAMIIHIQEQLDSEDKL